MYVCLCVCMYVSSVTLLCPTLWPHRLQSTRLLWPWNFPGKKTGVGCHFLLQDIFQTHISWGSCIQEDSLPLHHLGNPSTSSASSKNVIPMLTILKWHEILVLTVDAGNFALHLEEAEFHLQEGHLVFSTQMEQLPPCLLGSEHRGHREGFLSHTQHMVDPQYMVHLATKETSHMQPKHPMWRGRAAGNKNMASWKERRQSRPAGSSAQLSKAWQDKP